MPWLLLMLAIALGSSVAHANVIKPDAAAMKAAPAAFPFAEWDVLLKKYVDGKGRVDYTGLKTNAADLASFEKVFASVAATGPKTHPEELKSKGAREAYYLNAYNIAVWKNVLGRLGPKFTNVDKEKASFFF